MAGDDEELVSISALMLDQFTTYNMTGWSPRCGSDEFCTLTLLRRNSRFILRVTDDKQQEVDEIALDDVISYVIRVRSQQPNFTASRFINQRAMRSSKRIVALLP